MNECVYKAKIPKKKERDMTLSRAIRLLEKEYERAKKLEWVRNPVAYALYQTWKKADVGGKE